MSNTVEPKKEVIILCDVNSGEHLAIMDGEQSIAVDQSPVFLEDGQKAIVVYVDSSEDIVSAYDAVTSSPLRNFLERLVPPHLKRKFHQFIDKAKKTIEAVGEAISDLGDSIADNICESALKSANKVEPNLDSCVDTTADNFMTCLQDTLSPLGTKEDLIGFDPIGGAHAGMSPFSGLGFYPGFGGADPYVGNTGIIIPISDASGAVKGFIEIGADQFLYHSNVNSPLGIYGSESPSHDVGTVFYVSFTFDGSAGDIEAGFAQMAYDDTSVDSMMAGAHGVPSAFGLLPPDINPLDALGLGGGHVSGLDAHGSQHFGKFPAGLIDFIKGHDPSAHQPTQIFSGEGKLPGAMFFGLTAQDQTADPSINAGLIAPYGAPVPSGIVSEGRDAAGSVEGYSARDDVRHTTVEASSGSGKGGDGEKQDKQEKPKEDTKE